jgi:hypothetical protein
MTDINPTVWEILYELNPASMNNFFHSFSSRSSPPVTVSINISNNSCGSFDIMADVDPTTASKTMTLPPASLEGIASLHFRNILIQSSLLQS